MTVTPERLEFATGIFFRECARQFTQLHPTRFAAGEMPVKPLGAYPAAHQRAMIAAIKVAVEAATGPSMDDLFVRFINERTTQEAS